ncbi:MAG: dephospho-CoA kinase [Sedimentisphaerales bacterium]|nr:dephospho-CoA kinase [Sedimentisphaerales bacterium]
MGNPTEKPLIGIIGGIGSGKSTVAAEFKNLGCAVIDADSIAHELLREDEVRDTVIQLFGPGVLNACGELDRKRLAAIVFADTRRLSALNGVLHPRVLQRTEELIAQYNTDSHTRAIVLDMPLLAEVGWADRCDKVIFVACDRKRRVERASGFLSDREIEIRENSQISLDSKARLADNIVDNNSDFSALVRQITEIFSEIAK